MLYTYVECVTKINYFCILTSDRDKLSVYVNANNQLSTVLIFFLHRTAKFVGSVVA